MNFTKTKSILIWTLFIFWILITKVFAQSTWNLPEIVIDTGTNDILIEWYTTNASGEIILESWYYSPYVNSWIVQNSTWSSSSWTINWTVTTGSESINSGVNLNTWATNTGTTPNIDIVVNSWNMLSEFGQALAWMYANWITTWWTEKEYMPDEFLTREQASKLIWKTYQVLWYSDITKNQNCNFKDSNTFTPVLSSHVQNACKRWLFKWDADWNFWPVNNISKAGIMAVLIRMLEWKISDENTTPRRNVYYKKWYAIWITNQSYSTGFENSITRREIAIFLYRLKNIVTNEKLKTISLNTISQIKPDVVNPIWTGERNEIIENLSAIANNVNAINDPELQAAIGRMYDNWLTSFNSITEYKPFDVVLRLQAAKVLSIFSQLFNLSQTWWFVWNECTFSDLWNVSSEFKVYIENACKIWLLKWSNWKFNPEWTLYKSQFVVSLIRLFEWKSLDETTTPRRKNYFWKAQEIWIVWPADVITFDSPITRYELALYLYRFKVKYQMMNNLNNNRIPNEVITTVPWTIITWTSWLPEANVYLDTNLLKDWNFEIWYIEIIWTRYKIVKTDTVKYFTNSFVRYWDVFNMESDTKVWTVSFIINNNYVIESSVRLPTSSYKISPIEWINTYYKINQL